MPVRRKPGDSPNLRAHFSRQSGTTNADAGPRGKKNFGARSKRGTKSRNRNRAQHWDDSKTKKVGFSLRQLKFNLRTRHAPIYKTEGERFHERDTCGSVSPTLVFHRRITVIPLMRKRAGSYPFARSAEEKWRFETWGDQRRTPDHPLGKPVHVRDHLGGRNPRSS